jgi:hypothetical protein
MLPIGVSDARRGMERGEPGEIRGFTTVNNKHMLDQLPDLCCLAIPSRANIYIGHNVAQKSLMSQNSPFSFDPGRRENLRVRNGLYRLIRVTRYGASNDQINFLLLLNLGNSISTLFDSHRLDQKNSHLFYEL